MEELKHELEKLSKTYVDTPEKEEKILIPFIKRLLELSVKERRKLLPTIRELQWIKGKFSETFCDHHRHAFWVPYSSYVAINEKWTWDTT